MTLGFGTFERDGVPRLGFRSGDAVVDLGEGSLDALLAAGPRRLGARDRGGSCGGGARRRRSPLDELEPLLPFTVADYVDFYSSLEHATNLGRMFRPDAEPLLPNWRHLPVGYHGRAGTVVVSGTPIRRPRGQAKAPDADAPAFGPSRRLDVELELGFVVGVPCTARCPRAGRRLRRARLRRRARERLERARPPGVGVRPARPVPRQELRHLGLGLGDAARAARGPARLRRRRRSPEPLPHLRVEGDWALDLPLEIELNGTVISRGNARGLYWTMPQQLAHATSNGASVRTGDLMASGTISGAERGSEGSLIELTWNGARAAAAGDGSERTFLEDGDEVVLRGEPLGEVRGRILPA